MPKLHILLVEDNLADIDLTREFFENGKIRNSLSVVKDGFEAMEYLRREGRYTDAVVPSLILLDLNLPKKDGHEVLAEMRADPLLKDIPVVVLTTSREEEDMIKAYTLKANYYVCKPLDTAQLFRVIQGVDSLGFEIVSLHSPPSETSSASTGTATNSGTSTGTDNDNGRKKTDLFAKAENDGTPKKQRSSFFD